MIPHDHYRYLSRCLALHMARHDGWAWCDCPFSVCRQAQGTEHFPLFAGVLPDVDRTGEPAMPLVSPALLV